MNTQIIQLQETEGNGSVNGTWQNVVPTDLFLEEGDELNIKQAFIETSSKISIVDPLTATLHFTPYFVNHDDGYTAVQDKLLRSYEKTLPGGAKEAQPNNAMYIACNKKDPAVAGVQYELLKVYTLYGDYGTTVTRNDLFVIKFSYVDVVSLKTVSTVHHTTSNDLKSEGMGTRKKEKHYDMKITYNILSVKGSFKELSESKYTNKLQERQGNSPEHKFLPADIELIDANETYTPLEFTQSVDIPVGDYDPDDLAHILTTGLNKYKVTIYPNLQNYLLQTQSIITYLLH